MAFRLLADEVRARRLSPGLSNEALDERATGHNVAPAVPGRMLQAPCSRYSPGKETPRRPLRARRGEGDSVESRCYLY
jgi:hypothetical protein